MKCIRTSDLRALQDLVAELEHRVEEDEASLQTGVDSMWTAPLRSIVDLDSAKSALAMASQSVSLRKPRPSSDTFKFTNDGVTTQVFTHSVNMHSDTVRALVYFHGNGERLSDVSRFLKSQANKLGNDGLLIVAPENREGHWQAFRGPNGLVKLLEQAESQLPQGKCIDSVTLASFSGGYEALGRQLGFLQGAPINTLGPRAIAGALGVEERDETYAKIDRLVLLDSAYGFLDRFAEFAAQPGKKVGSVYTPHLAGTNTILKTLIPPNGSLIAPYGGTHGNAPLKLSLLATF